ncbi:2-oxo-4-hydroxy-4-carboxy-5-ureidoimidazoline decarboxylase [Luteolibacter sp. AS25]|uniref:2-oxo-4-hydroxy-4-carboxy-5-ureidoimidazoline decarboxylase n=1 Tax=Luteolibacter sp. AS25 TaxID=3135776 RepID=UPI00398A9F94
MSKLNSLPENEFTQTLAGIYEHSAWVSQAAFRSSPFNSRESLVISMRDIVDAASSADKLHLIRAHPDLGGKLARAGALTEESTREQAGLGLDRLSDAEFREFDRLNTEYSQKFEFPFIICARLTTKSGVLRAFKARLENTAEQEITEAIRQIHEIARLRIEDLVFTPEIPAYTRFLSESLLKELWNKATPASAIGGLRIAPGLREKFPNIETDAALQFVTAVYTEMKLQLNQVLEQRVVDRAFMDTETAAFVEGNTSLSYTSADYGTVLGKTDSKGRIVIGPLPPAGVPPERVDIPEFLAGDQVTLFGPPDTAKMSINAMNAFNRRSSDEHPLVTELAEAAGQVPRWGADNEDSKTPIMEDFLHACENLIGCFDRTLRHEDEKSGKIYELDHAGLSKPIKRIPGLALPDGSHLINGNPLPLHLFDFALHLWHNHHRPEALVFYVPKLENEEEALYLKQLIDCAERKIQAVNSSYQPGTVKLFIVFENPRAIFRISEIAKALHPHFLGGSLGWHDFLASAARLFKNDPRYRIPVKADPNIVINHIRESHKILVDALAPIDAIRIGGMYGILYEEGNADSYEVCMTGYIRDVTTQLKRGLNGFWVAHPAFVRTGLALVEAWRRGPEVVTRLIKALVPDPVEHSPLIEFVFSKDVAGLDDQDPNYARSVLAATIETSDVIANDDPEEVRYNIFQALQYLCDWLCGNGCVALPTTMENARGKTVFVRVMDDLATTERSRWELWAEVNHGRVSRELFEKILAEEIDFIRTGADSNHKRVQIPWKGEAARWYPIAAELLHRLVTDPNPPEFVTEVTMPYTLPLIRNSDDPMATAESFG